MILVTGAAGKTGLAVLNELRDTGIGTRAFIHHEDQRGSVLKAGATQTIIGDLGIAESIKQAIENIDAIYLICPNVHPKEFEICTNFIEKAKAAKVKRVVFHSVMFPQIEAMPHHWQKLRVEEALIESGLDFTILQPASYMQNIFPYWERIVNEGKYVIPYSIESVFSPVDLEDVAKAARMVLTDCKHSGSIYQLIGPERINSEQMAGIISERLGKKVVAEAIPIGKWKEESKKRNLDAYATETLSKMFAHYDQFGFAGSSQTLEHLLDHPPTSFTQFISRIK